MHPKVFSIPTNAIIHLLLLLLVVAIGGCTTPDDPPLDLGNIEGALKACGDDPCIIIGQAFADENAPLSPLTSESELGLFDAAQGAVATWITVIAANVPAENPKLQIRMATDEAMLNVPNTLKVPFEKIGDNVFVRLQYMVQFLAVCCASDYEGLSTTLTAKLFYTGCGDTPMTVGTCGKACQTDADCSTGYACSEIGWEGEDAKECRLEPIELTIPITLREVPWPL